MSFLRIYGRVFQMLGPEKKLGVFLALANVGLAAAQFAEPVLFGRVIDALVSAQAANRTPSIGDLSYLLSIWAGFGLFSILVGVLLALHADRLSHRRRLAIITSYFEHVLHLPLAYHTGTHSGRLMKVMLQGADSLWGLWLTFFRDHFAAFVSIFILLPVAVWLNWRLGLLLVGLMIVFAAITSFALRQTESQQLGVERHHTDLAERTSDALGNVALVQSFTRVEAEVRAVKTVARRVLSAQIPVLTWWAVVSVATRAATTLTILAIFLYGTWLHIHGLVTIGEIVTFVNIATLFVGKLELVVGFTNRLVLEAPRLTQFFEVLDSVPIKDKRGAIDLGRARGEVEFDHVSLSYDGKRAAVDDVSFHVNPGETIAVVGATGAGKTTALSLLHRAWDPQKGAVRIDGHDIRELKLESLRRNIGVVFQEALLFNRSIEENLKVGKPDGTPEEMEEALRRAQASEFIARAGVEANVGERGRQLSGGERQRIAIARALLKDPPILILDEATSALDAATEKKVQLALDEVMKGRTTFVIAHRLATIRNANRIFVFHDGKIIEQGSFDELVKQNGRFADLARAQFMIAPEEAPAQAAR
ncbi:MAG TPA: glucan ABC transporter ATP-binding protein/ permease [Xanthobacteraceae bacterium]|jgi:ATP-binding cassette subfamily B protein|nr:glucan ABC transporter ATP-binding protein/ permease [Xanthobacteraceae bacterium]